MFSLIGRDNNNANNNDGNNANVDNNSLISRVRSFGGRVYSSAVPHSALQGAASSAFGYYSRGLCYNYGPQLAGRAAMGIARRITHDVLSDQAVGILGRWVVGPFVSPSFHQFVLPNIANATGGAAALALNLGWNGVRAFREHRHNNANEQYQEELRAIANDIEAGRGPIIEDNEQRQDYAWVNQRDELDDVINLSGLFDDDQDIEDDEIEDEDKDWVDIGEDRPAEEARPRNPEMPENQNG
ncbi:MAG: hypothetical protein WB791_09595 [Waddliaceae bacterium]